jgi:hypothetical protein
LSLFLYAMPRVLEEYANEFTPNVLAEPALF